MADGSGEPIGPEEVRILVQTGEDLELSDTVIAALDRLAEALNEEAEMATEVAGFDFRPARLEMGTARATGGGAAGSAGAMGIGDICLCKSGLVIGCTCRGGKAAPGPFGGHGGGGSW